MRSPTATGEAGRSSRGDERISRHQMSPVKIHMGSLNGTTHTVTKEREGQNEEAKVPIVDFVQMAAFTSVDHAILSVVQVQPGQGLLRFRIQREQGGRVVLAQSWCVKEVKSWISYQIVNTKQKRCSQQCPKTLGLFAPS